MEVKRFPLPITGSHLLMGLLLLRSPFEIPFPSGRRLRPESVREGTQKPFHHPTVLRPHRQRRPLYRCPVKSRGRAGSRTASGSGDRGQTLLSSSAGSSDIVRLDASKNARPGLPQVRLTPDV